MSLPFVKRTHMAAVDDPFMRMRQGVFLVVDDLESMRRVTSSQLRQLGATRIVEAGNGVEALKMLTKYPVTAILSDWNMPVMNGLELLLSVRSHQQYFPLPFLMITAEVERSRVMQAIMAGVSELLVKPYSAARFGERIERALDWKPRENKPIDPVKAMEGSGLVVTRTGDEDCLPGQVPRYSAPPARLEPPAAAAPIPAQESPSSADDGPEEAGESDAAGLPTLLVVDDAAEGLQLLSGLFKDDYRVKIAHNGEKALRLCHSDDPPDLVLLDVMMPGMDGFEVARRMRAHPSSEHIPIIFVTAMADDASRLRGMTLGAVDFVTKPIDPDGLTLRVRNFMRYVELHGRLQDEYDAMMTANRLREDVERITRHDVKAPLAGVIGLVQSLADSSNLGPAERDTLRLAEEAALQALNLINFSAELYKIETGRFTLVPKNVPVAKVLRRMAQMQASAFSVKALKLTVCTPEGMDDGQLLARGDTMLCHSMFQNLLKNACEAAPDHSEVIIGIRPGIDGGPLSVTIENRGAVPQHIRASFFEKFSTAGKNGGTGIGTYSARMLAEAQEGSVVMHTDDDSDSTCITVTLPPGCASADNT